MALDRQKILNELGSVMNQLKNTDCGCMGRLFGNSNQAPASNPGCGGCGAYRQSCCHSHGWSPKSCGEPYPSNTQNAYRPCMGQCNPPKLYAETYNYLTESLMQPTINEVYNDLKSINPNNTVGNNPIAQQMGLPKEQIVTQTNMPSMPAHFHVGNQNKFDNTQPDNAHANAHSNLNSPQQVGQYGGMGPQIMNMLGSNISKPGNMEQQGHFANPETVNATQYPQSNIGAAPVSLPTNNQFGHNQNASFVGQAYYGNQAMNQTNMNSQQVNNVNSNTPANNYNQHGQHTQGITKFNEMFPGVMKNGDLGFDPMAIAIQMNPANQKQAAMDTIQKIMSNNNRTLDTNINSANAQPVNPVNASANQYNMQPNLIEVQTMHQQVQQPNITNQQTYQQGIPQQQAIPNSNQLVSQQIAPQQTYMPNPNLYGATPGQVNQQAYTALTPSTQYQQQIPQQPSQYQQQQQQIPVTDPNNINSKPNISMTYEEIGPNSLQSGAGSAQMIKEPILPADKSRFVMPKQKYFQYNTLGQPIQPLPAKMYHTPEPNLPQTLSPQTPMKSKNYSNVKSTVSKTSIVGNRTLDKTPSRNQLQHIYNQYKGSQSYTQQNIKDVINKDGTHSDRRFNIPQTNVTRQQVPIEKTGGDNAVNNLRNDERTHRVENVIGEIGDVPNLNKPPSNIPEKLSPVANRKCRNGLQDMVYTSYPTSTAWSFHGHGRESLSARRYRY